MSRIRAHHRSAAAGTLFCFTITTLSPSLAWAAPSSSTDLARAVDSLPAEAVEQPAEDSSAATAVDLKHQADKVEAAAAAAKGTLERPDKGDLQGATSAQVDKSPAKDALVEASDAQAAALPTGADKSGVTSQSISVPKGEGTIQGMGESFSAQLSTGIATFSVPFALPAARGGAQPSLGLSYSSASGAGLAGMGWSVGVPFIARQTDRGLPNYADGSEWQPNQDRFVFNGGQELVPICTVSAALSCEGALTGEAFPGWSEGHQYFRPRVEGSFMRFFWSADHRTWRVQDKSGVTMELGVPLDGQTGTDHLNGLEANPENSKQIYRWHLVRQYDTYGATPASANPASPLVAPTPFNVVNYKYIQDGGQAYLSDIYDTTPAADPTTQTLGRYAHHTHLEYESRSDPSETYRSGWLMTQTLRLARVDVASKTYTGGESGNRQLVRRYHLEYDGAYHESLLSSVQVEGRCVGAENADGAEVETNGLIGGTSCEKLPPMTFDYQHVDGFNTNGTAVPTSLPGYEAFDARLQQIGGDPPHSVDEEQTDYFDINADGLPDVLVTAPGVYGNDYGVFFNSSGGTRNTFGDVEQMGVVGVLGANSGTIKLSNANVAPLDADGDGIIDLLHMPKVKTYAVYHPRLVGSQWKLVGEPITTASQQNPKIDLGRDAAETRVLDVNFDGLVDLVVSTGTEFQTFFSLGRLPKGDNQFGHGEWASKDTGDLSNDPISKCVPYSGTPVRFSDSDIQLADMNGDGIQDIVRLRRGEIRYWPGRGNGFWGTGKLEDCPAGTFGDKRYRKMDDSPYFSDIQGTSLRIDDVNGDGLDDLVQVRFDAVDVWLNVDGKSWTKRAIIDGTPASPSYANRVRLMDINGSGTRDVVWGNGKKYQYIDLTGGERPGLLVGVKNGLGKSTSIEYVSSTEEMLAAERTGVKCGDSTAFDRAWCTKMPTVTHVVRRVTESDNLSVAGSGAAHYVTEYSYRDPVYEGRQREFRGFAHARSKRVGDANSPSDFTETTFLLGECEDETPNDDVADCAVSERWRDNPKEALKGLPVVRERYDENGVYLSTDASTYRLRELYLGLDGRHVRHAFEAKKRVTVYDTSAPTSAVSSDQAAVVQLEREAPAAIANLQSLECNAPDLPSETVPDSEWGPTVTHPTVVPLRQTSGYATTESATYVDAVGNAFIAVAKGCVAGACPAADPSNGLVADELICNFAEPGLPTGQQTGWLYRTISSWSQGSFDTAIRGKSSTAYSAEGAPRTTSVVFSDIIPLRRQSNYGGYIKAPDPSDQSTNGTRVVATKSYDAFGNLVRDLGPANRCRDVRYEPEIGTLGYSQFPSVERVYPAGCPAQLNDPTPDSALETVAQYDRGLELIVSVMDMSFQSSFVHYDQFGRLVALRRPLGDGSGVDVETVQVSYDLPEAGSNRAYSIIHTATLSPSDGDPDDHLNTYSYVDGMGRDRVGLSEADPDQEEDGHPYIVSSIAEFDAKGAVRRKYLPYFPSEAPDPSAFPVSDAPPDQPYGRQRYDAFGRQVQTFDVDGTITLQSRYHALSTDLYDAADLYPGPHQGSYASTRTDGHGRTVAATERVHVSGALEQHEVRTRYLASGQPQVITRINLATLAKVVRWMVYDSLGRMVVNADPHATVGFTETPLTDSAALAGLFTWHYVYNDAGDLVGTSDARGCGQNFVYDPVGRLKAEDYSPCEKVQSNYVTPNLTTGARYEVFYEYDDSASTIVSEPTGYTTNPAGYSSTQNWRDNLRGRLKAVHDRAATTWFKYDARGRTTTTYRKVSYIDAPHTTIAGQYVDHWYSKDFAYDTVDRPVEETTGVAQGSVLNATDGTSKVKTAYTRRGTLKKVGSSYGELVSNIKRSADGLVQQMTFGDAAATQTAMRYDSRRRLASVQTFRSEASLWSTAPPAITPAPGATDLTRHLLLQDLDYSYDVVGNPTEIRDWRTADDWPDGAKPTTRRMEYDDLYRVTRVDYEYPGGYDKFTSPYAAELGGVTDPRRPTPRGHKLFSKRPLWQTYQYDWLGTTSKTDDDQHAYYERSLGTITNKGASGKPYQFDGASQTATPHNGSTYGTTYDQTGNLTFLRITESTTACTTSLSACTSRFFYDWDEVGRLQIARRVEGEGPGATGPWLQFLYDANDERVVKEHYFNGLTSNTPKVSTLYVFDTLEIRRAERDATTNQYPVDSTTEVAYLTANGLRLARLHYEPPAKGEPKLATGYEDEFHSSDLHLLVTLPDHLGSASLVVDHATSELVEARTYQPYGATESDYRPDRWKGFREDSGFTGKEEDVEVGLRYFGKRYLSPYLGRWISADPLAVHAPGTADPNLYAYVRGAVLKAIDPVGLDCVTNNGSGGCQETSSQAATPANAAQGTGPGSKPAPASSGNTAGKNPANWVEWTPADGPRPEPATPQKVSARRQPEIRPMPEPKPVPLEPKIDLDIMAGEAQPAVDMTVHTIQRFFSRTEKKSFLAGEDNHVVEIDVPIDPAEKATTLTLTLLPEIQALGNEARLIASRQSNAWDFYRNNTKWDAPKIEAHWQNIDFTKPVDVVTLTKNTPLSQWNFPNNAVGNYFTDLGAGPSGLGVYTNGRIETVLKLTGDTPALRSTAADALDTWSVPGMAIEAPGGGIQYFIPP